MRRIINVLVLAAFAAAAVAQQPAKDADKVVATINGETITKAKLDFLYANMNAQMRANYDRTGGKMAFLDNYIAKRLMLQEAMKSGYEQRADVKAAADAAAESAVFDRYIRDQVGGRFVTEAQMRSYYEDNKQQFATPAMAKVYHIVISEKQRTHQEAEAMIQRIGSEINKLAPSDGTPNSARMLHTRFTDAARQWSEDGVGPTGGDLGWVSKGNLDPKFEDVAFSIPLGVMSAPVETKFGHHLILVEDRKSEGFKTFEQVMPEIRDRLLADKAADVMTAVKRITQELRQNSKVQIYKDNVE